MTTVEDLFDDGDADGDSPKSGSASLEDRLAKIEKDLAALIEGLAKKKKKEEYPYPEGYPKPKDKDDDEKEELKKSVEALEEEKTELSKKVSEFEAKEKATEINTLVNLELEKKLYSKEKAPDMAKEYQKLDLSAISALSKRVETLGEGEEGDQASLKAKELAKTKEGETETKIKELKAEIDRRLDAGLKTEAQTKELKKLEGGDE